MKAILKYEDWENIRFEKDEFYQPSEEVLKRLGVTIANCERAIRKLKRCKAYGQNSINIDCLLEILEKEIPESELKDLWKSG